MEEGERMDERKEKSEKREILKRGLFSKKELW